MTAPLPFLHDPALDTSTCPRCGEPAPVGTKACFRCCGRAGWQRGLNLTRAERIAQREAARVAFFKRKRKEREDRPAPKQVETMIPGGRP